MTDHLISLDTQGTQVQRRGQMVARLLPGSDVLETDDVVRVA